MKLKEVLKGVNYILLGGKEDIEINDIKYDSRKVEKNDIFVALIGYATDGHDYIPEAISRGASVIIVSKMVNIHGNVTIIKVDDARIALAYMSANYFKNPTHELTTIGVTGTAGKTTTTHIIKEMLEESGIKCGLIGSIGVAYNNRVIPTNNTTPESYEIHKAFREMINAGITHVVLECSSQSFKLNRLIGITFDIGVLTNLSTDYVDIKERKSQEEYLSYQNKLFLNSKHIIVNNDSKYLEEVLKNAEAEVSSYAIKNDADLKAKDINLINDIDFFGSEFTTTGVVEDNFKISLPGEFNIYNALCAIMVCHLIGIDIAKAKRPLISIRVRGRMENALITPKFKVLIDYAHTEERMQELVKTLKDYRPHRLISVFGSGGNTSKERRNNLGSIIGSASDLCIITEDNPRFEEISSINKSIKVGLDKVGAKYLEIPDRKDAIEYAMMNAEEGDLILLVGKGHEEYQDSKGTKYHFSEIEAIEETKKKMNL